MDGWMDKRISLVQVTLEQVKDVVYAPSVNRSATVDKAGLVVQSSTRTT